FPSFAEQLVNHRPGLLMQLLRREVLGVALDSCFDHEEVAYFAINGVEVVHSGEHDGCLRRGHDLVHGGVDLAKEDLQVLLRASLSEAVAVKDDSAASFSGVAPNDRLEVLVPERLFEA